MRSPIPIKPRCSTGCHSASSGSSDWQAFCWRTTPAFHRPWGGGLSNAKRVVLPIVAGLIFGASYVVFDLLTHFTDPIVARHGVTQQYTGFLPVFIAFSAASVLVEVIYRLLLIPLLLFLISNLLLRGRAQAAVFWALAILTSALEPLTMAADLAVLPAPLLTLHAFGLYALNFTQAVFFRRLGYLSAICVRVAFYLVWHALYVH